MAIMNFIDNDPLVQLGNRNDYCYLCARELKAKSEIEYQKKFQALKGKLEGQKVVKMNRGGTETCICLEHIHKIAKENPLPKAEK
jgi:hypothetical protein